MRPRSGLAAKYGISMPNAPGTIDADYRGEVKVPLINLGRAPFTVEPKLRIAQMGIQREISEATAGNCWTPPTSGRKVACSECWDVGDFGLNFVVGAILHDAGGVDVRLHRRASRSAGACARRFRKPSVGASREVNGDQESRREANLLRLAPIRRPNRALNRTNVLWRARAKRRLSRARAPNQRAVCQPRATASVNPSGSSPLTLSLCPSDRIARSMSKSTIRTTRSWLPRFQASCRAFLSNTRHWPSAHRLVFPATLNAQSAGCGTRIPS